MKQSATPTRLLMPPFSFNGVWPEQQSFTAAPLNWAEQQALKAEESAHKAEAAGKPEEAENWRKDSAKWRNEVTTPNDGLTDQAAKHASQALNILLIQATTGSILPLEALRQLVAQIHEGLNALASNEHKDAARVLVCSLTDATSAFNDLASRRPDLFINAVQSVPGIPGIISPSKEKTETNAELVEKLKVGTSGLIPMSTKATGRGKQTKLETPANKWASRLFAHVMAAQLQVAIFARLSPNVQQQWVVRYPCSPPWMEDAMSLQPISPGNLTDWMEVIWSVVMEATNGRPEDEPILFSLQALPAEHGSPFSSERYRTTAKAYQNKIKQALKRGLRTLLKLQAKACQSDVGTT